MKWATAADFWGRLRIFWGAGMTFASKMNNTGNIGKQALMLPLPFCIPTNLMRAALSAFIH